jgi:hypothetical protein
MRTYWGVLFGLFLSFGSGVQGEPAFYDDGLKVIFPKALDGYQFKESSFELMDEYELIYVEAESGRRISILLTVKEGLKGGPEHESVVQASEQFQKKLEENSKNSGIKSAGVRSFTSSKGLKFKVFTFSYLFQDDPAEAPQKCLASLFATTLQGRLLQVRASFPESERAQASAEVGAVVEQVVGLLATPVDEREMLLASIAFMKANPLNNEGKFAAKRLMDYTNAGEGFQVGFYPQFFPWMESGSTLKNGEFLVAAYIAGVLDYMIAEETDAGGELQGFIMMLETYNKLLIGGSTSYNSQLYRWSRSTDKEGLFAELISGE